MRVLVVGGAGYISSHTVRKLIEESNDIIVLDSLYTGRRKAADKKAKFYQGDIEDTNLISKISRDENIDAVMRLAAYSLVPESVKKPLKCYDNNVSGTISLLQAMDDAKVEYLVFLSSAATYGIPKTSPITEDIPLDPINPYGETKMMMEKIMHWADKADGIKSIALRCFNVAGVSGDGSIGRGHGPETYLIPNILKGIISSDGSFTIFGDDYGTKDDTNVRDYVQVGDLIDAHILALKHVVETNKSDVFSLGTAQGCSNLEILEAAKKVTGTDTPYTIGPKRGGDPDSLVADSNKVREILDWKPKHENVGDVITTAWNWHKSHPKGYKDKQK